MSRRNAHTHFAQHAYPGAIRAKTVAAVRAGDPVGAPTAVPAAPPVTPPVTPPVVSTPGEVWLTPGIPPAEFGGGSPSETSFEVAGAAMLTGIVVPTTAVTPLRSCPAPRAAQPSPFRGPAVRPSGDLPRLDKTGKEQYDMVIDAVRTYNEEEYVAELCQSYAARLQAHLLETVEMLTACTQLDSVRSRNLTVASLVPADAMAIIDNVRIGIIGTAPPADYQRRGDYFMDIFEKLAVAYNAVILAFSGLATGAAPDDARTIKTRVHATAQEVYATVVRFGEENMSAREKSAIPRRFVTESYRTANGEELIGTQGHVEQGVALILRTPGAETLLQADQRWSCLRTSDGQSVTFEPPFNLGPNSWLLGDQWFVVVDADSVRVRKYTVDAAEAGGYEATTNGRHLVVFRRTLPACRLLLNVATPTAAKWWSFSIIAEAPGATVVIETFEGFVEWVLVHGKALPDPPTTPPQSPAQSAAAALETAAIVVADRSVLIGKLKIATPEPKVLHPEPEPAPIAPPVSPTAGQLTIRDVAPKARPPAIRRVSRAVVPDEIRWCYDGTVTPWARILPYPGRDVEIHRLSSDEYAGDKLFTTVVLRTADRCSVWKIFNGDSQMECRYTDDGGDTRVDNAIVETTRGKRITPPPHGVPFVLPLTADARLPKKTAMCPGADGCSHLFPIGDQWALGVPVGADAPTPLVLYKIVAGGGVLSTTKIGVVADVTTDAASSMMSFGRAPEGRGGKYRYSVFYKDRTARVQQLIVGDDDLFA